MKKTLLFIAVIALATQTASAQKSTFGFTAGAVSAKFSEKSEGVTISSDSKIGFTFGIACNIPFNNSLSFQPALNYVQKGGKINMTDVTAKLKLNYIELPLNIVYNSPENKGHFFVGAGPSLAYGISAKGDDGSGSGDETLHFGSNPDDIAKPLEIGANVIAGYQFGGGFNIAFNYNKGLNNIASDPSSLKDHTSYFGLRIGYMISGNGGSKK